MTDGMRRKTIQGEAFTDIVLILHEQRPLTCSSTVGSNPVNKDFSNGVFK